MINPHKYTVQKKAKQEWVRPKKIIAINDSTPQGKTPNPYESTNPITTGSTGPS